MIDPIRNWKSERAAEVYESLRAANPHLPPTAYVAALDGVRIEFGTQQIPTVTLRLLIEMPDDWAKAAAE